MASLNTGLNTALSGLAASQTGIGVAAHNISNASTTGYSRQSVDLQALNVNDGAYQWKPVVSYVGNGVDSNKIQQARDAFLDVRYRTANAQYSDYNQRESDLGQVEDIFNEVSTSADDNLEGLSGQLSTLINDIGSYQTSPTSDSLPVTIKTDADTLVTKIKTDYTSLSTFETQEQTALTTVVGDSSTSGINGTLNEIATLNKQIVSMEINGQTANDLRDTRNNLLDTLSGELDISVIEQTGGAVTIQLEGDAAAGNNQMLLDSNDKVHTLAVTTTTDSTSGLTTTAVTWNASDVNNQTSDYATYDTTSGSWTGNSANIQGGSVNGYLAILNGDGSGTGAYGDVGVNYLKSALNDFAQSFADIMNSVSTSSGNGATLISTTGTGTGAAANISLSTEWQSSDTLFGDNYTGTSTGTYAQAFMNALDTDDVSKYNTSTTYTSGTLATYAATFSSKIANVVNDDTTQATNFGTQKDDLDTQRQSVSSVSIDEETVDLMKFQQMYGASARVITTINDMMSTLLSMAQ